MTVFMICCGIAFTLAGAFILARFPANDVGQLSSAPGGWSENRDEWDALEKRIQKRNFVGLALIISGLCLQIYAHASTKKVSKVEGFFSKFNGSNADD